MATKQKGNRLVDGLRELLKEGGLAIGPQTRQLIKKLVRRLEVKNIENPFDIEKKQP